MQQVFPLLKINLCGKDDLSGRDGEQKACFGPFLKIGPAPCGVMKALVAPGTLSEGSYSDGPSLEMS